MSVIIAGIHTGTGKTVCSAVICQALGYDYWKPVQAGDLENSDTVFIHQHVRHASSVLHRERYRLRLAASPHYAAELQDVHIKKADFVLPATANPLVVETAGGIMSPLANNFLTIDLIEHLQLPVILVASNYLGSINHSLLSWSLLQARRINTLGIVFCGAGSASSEAYILAHTGLKLLFSIPHFTPLNAETIGRFARTLRLDF